LAAKYLTTVHFPAVLEEFWAAACLLVEAIFETELRIFYFFIQLFCFDLKVFYLLI
jgi:hypothetical protein